MNCFWSTQRADKFGLRNQGATCYLNSVLQVLYMTEDFRAAVERHTRETPNTDHIDRQLSSLFYELENQTANTYEVTRKVRIDRVNVQQDAAEYFEKILRLTSSTASEVFHGLLTHTTTCSSCETEIVNSEAFWHLPISLLESDCGHPSVVAGVEHHFRSSALTGANQMYCDCCDEKRDATVGCVMQRYPEVLMLLLKRFMFDYNFWTNVKNNCHVDVPRTLQIPNGQRPLVYELYAIVDHIGSLRNGHYTAKIKDENGWYKFDDTSVTPLQPLFQDEDLLTSDTAYLLFYRKRNDSGKRRKTQEFVAGEDAEDQSALNELKEAGTGSPVQGQHASPGAETEHNAVIDTQCMQDYLPSPDLNNDNKVLSRGSIDKQGFEVTTFNPEKDVTQKVTEEESTSQRAFQTIEIPDSNTGTLEEQLIEKRPKVLDAKVITEEETVCCCQRICTTFIENIQLKISDDGKQNIVRCTEKHPHSITFDQLFESFKDITMIVENCQMS